jgi:16S rRNA (adenine1518-N6/adenine1519-N6)-dimethyltransferase
MICGEEKQLGQNFLLDLNLTAKIARSAGDLTGCDVLEVGPGPGGLTRGLLAEGARHVLAVEKDPRCLPALAEIAAAYPGRLTVLNGDALDAGPAGGASDPPVRVVANLPYNVGTELLIRWLTPAGLAAVLGQPDADVPEGSGRADHRQTRLQGLWRLALLAQWRADCRASS